MIYPDISVEEWCRRHPGLEELSDSCPKCGQARVTSQPVALLVSYRGLISPPHKCGPQFDLLTAVSIDEETNSAWTRLGRDQ